MEEIIAKPQEMEITLQLQQQSSTNNSQKKTSECIYNNNLGSPRITTPPLTPKIISTRSEHGFHPSTFIQADTTTFKQVVQMLTGSSETAKKAAAAKQTDPTSPTTTTIKNTIPPIKSPSGQKKQGFKLYERRNSMKNGFMISPLNPAGFNSTIFSPRKQQQTEILSPSILDFPSLALSPKTPLNDNCPSEESLSEEEKAIAEKKFYLHPSPRTTPREGGGAASDHPPPQLLPLFPLTSPRFSGSFS